MALLASFGMLYPNHTVYILFLPVPAKFAYFTIYVLFDVRLLGYAAYDFFSINNGLSRTDHVGHLGGLLYGVCFILKFVDFQIAFTCFRYLRRF